MRLLPRLAEKPVAWWVWLWGVNAVALLALLFFLPFRWWAVAVAVFFGTMEGVGVFATHHGGRYWPPLTDVVGAYSPYWVTFPATWALVAWAGYYWQVQHQPIWFGVLAGLAGWLNSHFDDKYDQKNDNRSD